MYLSLLPLYIQYKTGMNSTMPKDQMRVMAVEGFNSIFIGMTELDITEYFSNVNIAVKQLLNKTVVEEVQKTRKEGFHTVILSGAYNLILNNIGKELGIDTVIGTEIHFKNGILNQDRQPDIISGSSKIEKLRNHFKNHKIDWNESTAYADSCSDLSLLETVGHPVAVNPDTRLKTLALERKWRIIFS